MKKQIISIEKIKKWANSQPFVVIAFVLLVAISSLVTITEGVTKLNSYYFSSFWKSQNASKKIATLNINTPIDLYFDILGKPYFINNRGTHTEYIFIDDLFYVQAVSNSEGRVVLYSITTRDKYFHPKIYFPYTDIKGNEMKILLGKTKFPVIPDVRPESANGTFTPKQLFYSEIYWLGNPGRYLTYGLTYNSAGTGDVGEIYWPLFMGTRNPDAVIKRILAGNPPKGFKKFRDNTVVNTYSVISNYEFSMDMNSDRFMILGPEMMQLFQLKDWKYPN